MTENKLYKKTELIFEYMLSWVDNSGDNTSFVSEALNQVRINWIEFFIPDQHKYLYKDKFTTLYPNLGLLYSVQDDNHKLVSHTFASFDYMYYLNVLMVIDNALYNCIFLNIFVIFIILLCIYALYRFLRSKSVSNKDRNVFKLMLFLLLLIYVFVYKDYAQIFFPFSDATSYRTLENSLTFYRYFFFKRVCILGAIFLVLLYVFLTHFYYIKLDDYIVYLNFTRTKYYINLEKYKFYTVERIEQNTNNRWDHCIVFLILIFFMRLVAILFTLALFTLVFLGYFASPKELTFLFSFNFYKALHVMELRTPTFTLYPMEKFHDLWMLEYKILWLFLSHDSMNVLTIVNTIVASIRFFFWENNFIEGWLINIFGDIKPIHNNYFYKIFYWIVGCPEFLFVFTRELFKAHLNLFWCIFNVIEYYINAELYSTMHDFWGHVKEINTGIDEHFRINYLSCDTYIIYDGDKIKYYNFEQVKEEKLQKYSFFRRKK
jgi:hypothetical protein